MKTWHKIIFGDSTIMKEVDDETVHLIITSPPYPMIEMWDSMFENAGAKNFDEMHEYLGKTWEECKRVLVNGGIACINIGDATRRINGGFRLYPNHSRTIEIFESLGFHTLPYILWRKPTNKPNAFLGSGFLPPNAYVTLEVEYILIFRKGGLRKFVAKDETRYNSKYTKEERDSWFSQVWEIKGERQNHNELLRRTAAFPEEIPRRLIRMFSVVGDTILDPFLGTGSTTTVAKELQRNSVGYEIEKALLPIIKERFNQKTLTNDAEFQII